MTTQTFASSTLLLSLNISVWSGNKMDKSETETVRARNNTKAGAVRVHKSLLPDAQELLDLKKFTTACRDSFNARTAPWAGDMRIMRSDAYLGFAQLLAEHRRTFGSLVDKLCDAYSSRVYEAQTRLGSLFDPADYPDVGTIREAHSFAIRVAPTPSVSDWRLDLNDEVMDYLREELETQSTTAMGAAMADIAERIADVARKAHARLSDPDGIFRDSLVKNIDELVILLPTLNVAGDQALDDLAYELRMSVFGVTPDKLRNEPDTRRKTATAMDQLAANAEALADIFASR